MPNELTSYYKKYHVGMKRLQLIAGFLPKKNASVAYRLLAYINASVIILAAIAILEFSYKHISNLYLFFGAFSLGVSFTTSSQKIISFICYRKRVADLHNSLEELFNKDFEDNEMHPILLSPVLLYYRISFNQTILMTLTTVLVTLKPIFAIIIQLSKGSKNPKFFFPFPVALSWVIPGNNLVYWIHYAFAVYTSLGIVFSSASIDALFGYYIFQMRGQLRCLSRRMVNLDSKGDYGKIITECVTKYNILIKCRKHLECIYGPIVLYLIVTSSVLFCGLLYTAVQNPKTALPTIVFILMKLLQIFSYGAFGTSLVTENDAFRDAIYMSDWPGSGDKSLMTTILTMILCNEPFHLRACFVSGISVEMFLAFLNTTVSYYLMIRTLEEGRST